MTRQTLPRFSEALEEVSRSFGNFCSALADIIRACVEFTLTVLPPETIEAAAKDPQLTAALLNASPRVRHQALHGRKHRTRKKNRNRALREYQREETQP